MKKNHKNSEQGAGLIMAVAFIVVMALMATATMSRVSNHTRHVEAHSQYYDTYIGLSSGMWDAERVRDESAPGAVYTDNIPVGFDFTLGQGETVHDKILEAMDGFYDPSDPGPLTSSPNVQYSVYSGPITTVAGAYMEDAFYVTSRYQLAGNTTNSRTLVNLERTPDVPGGPPGDSKWDNAIYAGFGQNGNLINGNVSIHGSVHILGNETDIGDVVFDLSGTAKVYNNYDGMPSALENNLSADPGEKFNGLEINDDGDETLNSKVRVKNGMVSINGNSSLGQTSADAGSKATVDAVYANNEWTGNQVKKGIPKAGKVNSDNGWTADYTDDPNYSAGNTDTYPFFSDIVDVDTGQVYFDPADATSFYHVDQTPYQGTINLEVGDTSTNFYYNSSTGDGTANIGNTPGSGGMPTYAEVSTLAGNDEFVVWFDADAQVLVVNGRVAVNGDVLINSGNGAGNASLDYEGKGSMLAYDDGSGGGNVEISADMYTTDFPTGNAIGIMAEYDFTIGTSSQMDLMGGFYAQGTVSMDKQTELAGTIIGSNFDLGSNVPSIYQVPELVDGWEDDMRMIADTGGGGGGIPGNGTGRIWFEIGVLL